MFNDLDECFKIILLHLKLVVGLVQTIPVFTELHTLGRGITTGPFVCSLCTWTMVGCVVLIVNRRPILVRHCMSTQHHVGGRGFTTGSLAWCFVLIGAGAGCVVLITNRHSGPAQDMI